MKPMQLSWLYLLAAGLFEIAWAVAMKYSQGFTRTIPTLLTYGCGFVSFYLLSLATERLPIGTSYAVWTGIGAIGTVVLGMILFGESREWPRLACIALILAGIVGLRLTTAAGQPSP